MAGMTEEEARIAACVSRVGGALDGCSDACQGFCLCLCNCSRCISRELLKRSLESNKQCRWPYVPISQQSG
eukprot:1141296-Pelagomonas_calceolata.AAC.11